MRSYSLLKYVFLLLAFVLLFGTAGFVWIEKATPFDALYMTMITITTVGYGEIVPLHPPGRLLAMGLMLAGFGVLMLAITVLIQAAVEGALWRGMEKKRVLHQIQKFRDHYVICGCGRIGRYVLNELLAAKATVVVIEQDQEVIDDLTREGVFCLHGSGAEEETLIEANIAHARGLVVTVATDAETVFIILTAHDLNPNLFVIARAIEEKNEDKLRRAGADRVISPYRFIGQRLAGSLLHPAVVDMLDTVMFGGELDLGMEGLIVEAGSPLAGQALRESGIRDRLGLTIIGIRKAQGNMLFNPTADEVIEPGDTLISMGEKEALKKLTAYLSGELKRL